MISEEMANEIVGWRCDELVKLPAVRRIMKAMHREGKSLQEIKDHVIHMAISTFIGKPYQEVTHEEMSLLRPSVDGRTV